MAGRAWAGAWAVLFVLGCTGGSTAGPSEAPPGDSGTRSGFTCAPKRCAELGLDCGTTGDGCGGTLDCGAACPAGQTCGGGGTPNVCGAGTCTPRTCSSLGAECGTISDGCGALLTCGTCPTGERCGGGGVASVCGATSCAPKSCEAQGKHCGQIADGCGATLDCGTCPAGEVCGGGGVPNVCASRGIAVTISPAAVTLAPLARQQFSATVTGSSSRAVIWSVREGSAGGSIDASGLYQAPSTTGSFTVVATSAAEPGASASAAITVASSASLSVEPVSAQQYVRLSTSPMRTFPGDWVKFEALASGAPASVSWSVAEGAAGGTISSNGTYVAPQTPGTFHVIATSTTDPSARGTVTVQIVDNPDLWRYGGPVLPQPKLTLIWWGSDAQFQGGVERLHAFLDGVNGSAWFSILDPYLGGATPHASLDRELFDPSPLPDTSSPDFERELCGVLDAHGLTPSPTEVYVIPLAKVGNPYGYHTVGTCHGVHVTYVVLRLAPTGMSWADACGGYLSIADTLVAVFSHELAETITDPEPPSGWTDLFAMEVADVCGEYRCATLQNGQFTVNMLYSNARHACAY